MTKYFDARKLNRSTLEYIRIQVIRTINRGTLIKEVCQIFGVSRSKVYEWIKRVEENGLNNLIAKVALGKKPLLNKQQKEILELEERHPPTSLSLNSQISYLDTWIAQLPLAHTGKTAKLLYTLLNDLNHLDFPAENRFLMLERLYSVLAHLNHAISRRYLGASFPLTERNRRSALLAREFQENMAIGYKIIISDQLTREDCDLSSMMFATTLHRSLLHISQTLLKYYEIYVSPPSVYWKEIHWIYRVSEAHGLHRQIVPLPVSKHRQGAISKISNTSTGIYKQILIFALIRGQ